jgi:replicative DNA helicase
MSTALAEIMDLDIKILAYTLGEKRLMLTIQAMITPEYFQSAYQSFYKLLIRCFEKFKEIPTLRVMEEQCGGIWNQSFIDIYSEALNTSIDPKELPADLDKLKVRYNAQIVLKLGKDIFQENWNGKDFKSLEEANKSLKKTVSNIDLIYGNKVFKEGSLSETAIDTWNDYKKVKDNPELARGVRVGLREFDRITNGVQNAELVLIGGEPTSGKSTLAMNMAINAWLGENKVPSTVLEVSDCFNDSGKNILYFTLEMPYKAQRRRIDACVAGVPLYGIRDGNLTPAEEERFKAALKFQKIYNKQFHVVDIPRGCTVTYIESKYVEKCYEFKPDLVVVDYISLMAPDEEQGSDWLNLGRIAEHLHEFCRAYNVPVISPVQLTRPNKSAKKDDTSNVADQSRVGRSFMLVQNANIIINIEKRPDEDTRCDMIIRIAKMRDGETTSFVLHKRLDMMRIYDDLPGWSPEEYAGKLSEITESVQVIIEETNVC